LVAAIREAHSAVIGGDPPTVSGPIASMWRDSNVFAELGIAVVNYGPRSATHAFKRALTIDSLYLAACVYARARLEGHGDFDRRRQNARIKGADP
jgi:hypothetical protein